MIGFLTLTQQEEDGSPGEPISLNVGRVDAVRPESDGAVVVLANGDQVYVTESHDTIMLLMARLLEQ